MVVVGAKLKLKDMLNSLLRETTRAVRSVSKVHPVEVLLETTVPCSEAEYC